MADAIALTPLPAETGAFELTPLPAKPTEAVALTPLDSPIGSAASTIRAESIRGSGGGGAFARGARRGVKQSAGLAGQLLKSIGDETGFASLVDIGDELIEEAFVEAVSNPAQIDELGDVNSLGKAWTFFKQTFGEQAFNLGLAATGGGLGAFVGRAAVTRATLNNIAKRAAAKNLDPVKAGKRFFAQNARGGALPGAAAGTFGAFYPINTGEILQEQRDAGAESPAFGPSLALGAVSSGLEVLGFGLVGKAIFGKAKKEVVESMINTVLRRVGHASLKGVAAEGGTEAVQEVMVIASKKLNDPTFSIHNAIASSEGLSRIAFAGVSGAIVGGGLGGGGGIATGVRDAVRAGAVRSEMNSRSNQAADAARNSVPSGNDEEVQSLFDLSLAKKNIVQLGKGVPRAVGAALSAIKNRLGEGTVGPAIAAAKQRYKIVSKALNEERSALRNADNVLATKQVEFAAAIASLEKAIDTVVQAPEKRTTKQDKTVAKTAKEVQSLLSEFKKLSGDKRAARATELLTKARELTSKSIMDPGSVAKKHIDQLVSAAKKYVNDSHAKTRRDSKKYHKTLEMLRLRTANAIRRVRVANKEFTAAEAAKLTPEELAEDQAVRAAEREGRAEDSGFLPTPAKEIVASAYQVRKGRRDFAFAVGRTIATLPPTVRKAIKAGELEAVETEKEVILNLPGVFKTTSDAKRRSFTVDAAEVAKNPETAVVAKTDSKQEVTTVEKLPEVRAKLEAQGEEVEVITEPDLGITAQVEELNAEAEAAPVVSSPLTTEEVHTLTNEDTEIFVRTASTNRLMHAFVDAEGNLRREDGLPFRLYDTLQQATKGAKDKTTVHKVKSAVLQYFIVKDKFGKDKYVVLSALTNGRRQSAERQVRKALDRGMKHTRDKVKRAVSAVRSNGKKVWFHAGELTALGLILDAGSTQSNQKGRYANSQTLFLDGLSYLMAQQDSEGNALFTIKFDPTTPVDANKQIYGTVAYKDAGPNQDNVIPRTKKGKVKDKGFVEWAIDKVLAKEIPPTILRGLLWNYGFLSNEEIAAFDRMSGPEQERTLIEGLALVQSTIFEGTGLKKETSKVRQPLALEEDQDISEETLHLPSYEAQLVPISGEKKPDTSVPYAYADSLSDQALGFNQHAPHKSTGQLTNFITKWPAVQAAVEYTLKQLHIKEKVVLFDEDSLSMLITIYHLEEHAGGNTAERSALYRGYREQLEKIATEAPAGRIFSPPQRAKGDDRVVHIFVSNRPLKHSRGRVVMHEVGHLVQYVHLDRLSPRLRALVLDTMQGDTELFADYMGRIAADIHYGRKVRAGTEVDNIFIAIVQELKVVWDALRSMLGYDTNFDQFVAALNSHAATQRGEAVPPLKSKLAKQIFAELEALENSGAIQSPTTISADTAVINIWAGSNQNRALSNLAARPFVFKGEKYVSVEHAYQTWKSGTFDATTYNKTWRDGTKIRGTKRVNKDVSIPLMRKLIKLSFEANPKAKQALINTGSASLTHNAPSGRSDIWTTTFPKLLMEYRSTLAPTADFDDTVDAAVERANDSVLGNVVEDFNNLAKTFKQDPILAVKTLVRPADAELRSMGETMTKIAKMFRALPGVLGESGATIFRKIQMRGGPFHRVSHMMFQSVPSMRMNLWEIMNPRPSAATRAKRAHRNLVSEALLLQTKDSALSAEIKDEVRMIRQYFKDIHTWYTSTGAVEVHMPNSTETMTVQGMGLKLEEWGYRDEGRPAYYPMMVDSLFLAKNNDKFMEIMARHGWTDVEADNIRMKIIRDEDGGLNNGFQESAGTDNFFGPGFSSGQERNKHWTPELRAELVREGFYQHDIATTITAYTEMIVRRAVWQTEFSERRPLQGALLARYDRFGDQINMHGPAAKLQLWVHEARANGEINEWQFNRVIRDILPAYAGQLGLRTNSKLRKLNSGIVIYQNFRILPFAIFSQYVDVGTMAARGDFQSFQNSMSGMFDKTTRKDAREMMEILGAIRQGITEHVLSEQALSTFSTSTAKRMNDMFFHYNLMEGWTNGIRVATAIAGRDFITRNARIALEGTGRERELARHKLASIGLATERELADAATWEGFTTDNEAINAALLRFVDESMIRPDPTMRPVHMSDASYVVLNHLKNFLWGFYGTFIKRGIYEARVHHNLLPLFTLGMMALPFAALGYELRRKILGTSKNAPEGGQYLMELTERAGLLGPWQLVADMEQADDYGNPAILALGGPALEQFASFVNKDMSYWVPRAIPVVASVPVMRDWARDTF